ncbi:ISNCY family transposase [Microvirga sp. TS319]|uniref:ISNCY family transposase n=1 Tax=Microvirga sp. TS319 TaxID=3241165 RepID=UPI00351A3BD9
MTVIAMSRAEIARVHVLRDVVAERITVREAAQLLPIPQRQVFRWLKADHAGGPAALVSSRRGKPSNRSYPAALRSEVLALITATDADFGPTLACEKLAGRHGIALGVETIRRWMIAAGLWQDRHQPRYRRDCVGELIQIDGSEHDWFEDRGPPCTLLVYIDDATSRLMHLKFVETESTFAYFRSTREYLEAYGKPVAFYSDKHATFRINKVGATGGDGMTQFGRALHQLDIDIICAIAPQAKGRVERANGTLQDRLVKELRLAGISTLEAGNAFLPAFIADFNRRFAKAPYSDKDLHRPLSKDDELDDVFAWREERTVSRSLTLQYDQVLFILEPNAITLSLARQRVIVYDYPDGRLAIKHKGLELPYRPFDRRQQVDQAAIVENKRLGPVLAYIAERQKELDMSRSRKAPRRRGQAKSLFKVG